MLHIHHHSPGEGKKQLPTVPTPTGWGKGWPSDSCRHLEDIYYGMCQAAAGWAPSLRTSCESPQVNFGAEHLLLLPLLLVFLLQPSILMQWSGCDLERAAPDKDADLSAERCVGIEDGQMGWQAAGDREAAALKVPPLPPQIRRPRGCFGIFERPWKKSSPGEKKSFKLHI